MHTMHTMIVNVSCTHAACERLTATAECCRAVGHVHVMPAGMV
jgi:hypothetical protein